MSMHLLTVSEEKAFQRCHRYHQLRYRLGYRPVSDALALSFGKLFHVGTEAWWNTVGLERALEAIQPKPGQEMEPFEFAKVEALLMGYHVRWVNEDLETVATEVEFQTELTNPKTGAASKTFRLGGKIDAIAKDPQQRHFIVEHKTTVEDISMGSEYWQRLRLDAQISTYFVGARSLGYDIHGCLYDVTRKPLLRPSQIAMTDEDGVKIVRDISGNRVKTKDGRKWRETGDKASGYELQTRDETPQEYKARLMDDIAQDPDKYFARGYVMRLEQDELDAATDMWQVAQQIREAKLFGRYPRNPSACVQWNRTCEYFGVCTGSACLDDQSLFRRAARPHEELSAA